MARKCVGLIEAIGLASAIQAADAAVKSGNVALIGYEYSGYDAHIVVKVEGNVGAVKAAVRAAKLATKQVKGYLSGYESVSEKTGLDEHVYDMLIHNKQTVGDPLQVASGKRPQGTGKSAKWVGHWDPYHCYIYE